MTPLLEKQNQRNLISKTIFFLLILFSASPLFTPSIALFSGFIFAGTLGNPYSKITSKIAKITLQIAVVGLGFGMNLHESLQTGAQGVYVTLFSVIAIMVFGNLIGRWLKLSKATSYLISTGTAICGGSAIAAVAPTIRANEVETSVSLSTVFALNSLGLILFPILGHFFHLSQTQFGLWAAIAIHDTSSVVGAGATYGTEALKVATTIKLTRALWIIPLLLISTYLFRNNKSKISIPWFILLYVVAMSINTFFQIPNLIAFSLTFGAKRLLAVTLFLIGAGLSRSTLKSASIRSFVLGITLWVVVSFVSLLIIMKIG